MARKAKSDNAPKRDPDEVRPTEQNVPVPLEGDRLLEAGRKLADACARVRAKDSERKEAAKEFADDLKDLNAEVDRLVEEFRSGEGSELTDVEIRYWFAEGRVQVVRVDSGAVVEDREITDEERQSALDV